MENESAATLQQRKNKEKNRLKSILKKAGAEEWKIKMLLPVIDNTAWMSVKLEDTISMIGSSEIAIAYNNGGGQEGIRQNPLFQGYEALWKSYMSGMNQIMAAAGDSKDDKADKLKPKSVIQLVMEHKQK